MNTEYRSDLERVACITVSFNPDIELLRRQFAVLPADCPKVLVDNASERNLLSSVREVVNSTPNCHMICNPQNLGLAAAINSGVKFASRSFQQADFALLLDQDTEPRRGSIEALVEAFDSLRARGEQVGCVGPTLIDTATGLTHGFHQQTRWRWKRVYPDTNSRDPVKCANINGSGTLVPLRLFNGLGGLDETLFIDHVDTDWSFRVLAAGFGLYGIPGSVFEHRMGAASKRLWLFRWYVLPARSPRRHYFLFRNAVMLMRRSYVPRVWKIWAVAKLSLTFVGHALFDPSRCEQARQMGKGVRDGLRTRAVKI